MPKSSQLDDLAKLVASEIQSDAKNIAGKIRVELVPQSRVVSQDQFLDHHAERWMNPGHQDSIRDQHGHENFAKIQQDLIDSGRIPAGLPPPDVLQDAMMPPGPIQVPPNMAVPNIPPMGPGPMVPQPMPAPLIPLPPGVMSSSSVPPLAPSPSVPPLMPPSQMVGPTMPMPPPEGMILPPAVLEAIRRAQMEGQRK